MIETCTCDKGAVCGPRLEASHDRAQMIQDAEAGQIAVKYLQQIIAILQGMMADPLCKPSAAGPDVSKLPGGDPAVPAEVPGEKDRPGHSVGSLVPNAPAPRATDSLDELVPAQGKRARTLGELVDGIRGKRR